MSYFLRDAERKFQLERERYEERVRELEERLTVETARDQEFIGLKLEMALLQEQRETLSLKLRKAEKLLSTISN